jgi:hypothetical protein
VLAGESVPTQEKIISIFKEHINIICKDRRDTYYGHNIYVTSGSSNLILACVVLEGNLADSALTRMMLDRQEDIYGHPPLWRRHLIVVEPLMQIWRRLKLMVSRMSAFPKAVILRKKLCAGAGQYTKVCENFVQI